MITSPKQYDPDSIQAKWKRGIENLKVTRNSHALTVCHQVLTGNENLKGYQRHARIALAASNGITVILLKWVERK